MWALRMRTLRPPSTRTAIPETLSGFTTDGAPSIVAPAKSTVMSFPRIVITEESSEAGAERRYVRGVTRPDFVITSPCRNSIVESGVVTREDCARRLAGVYAVRASARARVDDHRDVVRSICMSRQVVRAGQSEKYLLPAYPGSPILACAANPEEKLGPPSFAPHAADAVRL